MTVSGAPWRVGIPGTMVLVMSGAECTECTIGAWTSGACTIGAACTTGACKILWTGAAWTTCLNSLKYRKNLY